MEIRRCTAFRLLLTASFVALLTKVCLVTVKPLCIIAERYSLCDSKWLIDESRYIDYPSVFLMTSEEASHFDLPKIYQLLSVQSNFNKTNINNIKKQLSRYSDPSMLISSKQNMHNPKILLFALEDKLIRNIPLEIFNSLSKKTYATFGKPSKCSVVGSSGILNNSSCGEQIDSADFVIRFNVPPLVGYKGDVGSKSHITTINPSQIGKQFGGLFSLTDRRNFHKYVKQYDRFLWISAFASQNSMITTRSLLRATRFTRASSILLGNPQHWRTITKFWWSKGLRSGKRLSSGIYWVANALSFCEEVHLYGFWPFAVNSDGEKVRYHYYEDQPPTSMPSKSHSFGGEFEAILQLHKKGVLRVHVDKKCE